MLKDKILSIAVLAVSLVACTSDDLLSSQSVAPSAEGLPFCAVISTGAGARTRVITENTTAGTLMTAWELNDEVALIHDNLVDIMKVDSIDDVTGDVVHGQVARRQAVVELLYKNFKIRVFRFISVEG